MTSISGASHQNVVADTRSGRRRVAVPSATEAGVPALEARAAGPAERFAAAVGLRPPVVTFLVAVIGGIALLTGLSILIGLLVTHVLVTSAGLGGPDNSFVRTLAHHRSGTLNTVSEVGSAVGGAPVLPILAGLIAIACALARRWRIAAFAVFVLASESAVYRLTTFVIHRHRPNVHRLEHLPVNASFPSGHTAASIAVYSGLAFLLTSRMTSGAGKVLVWTLAILMTVYVAFSRMYRGMHHPLDVGGGIVIGIGAIVLLVFACRAAGAAAEARAGGRTRA